MFQLNFPHHFVEWLIGIADLSVTIILFIFLFLKRDNPPKLWKAALVTLVGIFSFSFTFNLDFASDIRLPVLPLGVWILYWYFHKKQDRWKVYRKFAWFGFIANFIFAGFALLEAPLQKAIYPTNELSTYISDIKDASIIVSHTSQKEAVLDKKQLHNQITSAQPVKINADDWYYGIVKPDIEHPIERFPYILDDVKPMWGSGMGAMIYLEKDGKGLLVTTSQKQWYYRLKNSIIKENH